jgi:hypothetical protein
MKFPLGETLAALPPTTKQWDGGLGAIGVVSFFILGAWTLIDPGFHQRVASARDPETGKRGVLIATVCWVVFDALTVTTGMYAISKMPSLPENKLLIFPMFGDQVLPPGLKAVFLCGMLGTILTAMVGYSLVSGATLGRDILARLTGTTVLLGRDDHRRAACADSGQLSGGPAPINACGHFDALGVYNLFSLAAVRQPERQRTGHRSLRGPEHRGRHAPPGSGRQPPRSGAGHGGAR